MFPTLLGGYQGKTPNAHTPFGNRGDSTMIERFCVLRDDVLEIEVDAFWTHIALP
jgi:hypothetical protein